MKGTPTNSEAKIFEDKLKFTSLPEYVNSLKEATGMDDEEASMMFWVIEMWNKKRFLLPRFEINK